MKFYGEKSFSSFMYKLLIAFYTLSIITAVAQIIFLVFGILVNPVVFNYNKIDSGMFSIDLGKEIKVYSNYISATLTSIFAVVACKIYVGLFENFKNNIIFDKENLKYLRYSAYLELLGGFLQDVDCFFQYKLAVANIHIPNLDINYSILSNTIDALFVAATYFMIAIALEKAIEYKEENELTV